MILAAEIVSSGLIGTLIILLILALVLYLIWYLVGLFIKGTPHQIVGIVLGLIFLLFALQRLGFVNL